MIELNTKSAVITGSSRGIGEAIAIEFAKAGYNLVINSQRPRRVINQQRGDN